MQEIAVTLLCIVVTLAAYVTMRKLYVRYNHPLLNVVVLSAAIIIVFLLACGLDYNDYGPAREVMTFLIGPATVGLAVPLYRYRNLLKQAAGTIAGSVAAGSFAAMTSAAVIASLGGLPQDVVMSIMPKGVSIPFAVEIAELYGGIPALAAAFVVATGTLGSLLGVWSLDIFKIRLPLARGLALGTVSHAQGTAAALMEGELQGAMAGLAMILAGIFTALFSPVTAKILSFLA